VEGFHQGLRFSEKEALAAGREAAANAAAATGAEAVAAASAPGGVGYCGVPGVTVRVVVPLLPFGPVVVRLWLYVPVAEL
jgi:hypothetical protein